MTRPFFFLSDLPAILFYFFTFHIEVDLLFKFDFLKRRNVHCITSACINFPQRNVMMALEPDLQLTSFSCEFSVPID